MYKILFGWLYPYVYLFFTFFFIYPGSNSIDNDNTPYATF